MLRNAKLLCVDRRRLLEMNCMFHRGRSAQVKLISTKHIVIGNDQVYVQFLQVLR